MPMSLDIMESFEKYQRYLYTHTSQQNFNRISVGTYVLSICICLQTRNEIKYVLGLLLTFISFLIRCLSLDPIAFESHIVAFAYLKIYWQHHTNNERNQHFNYLFRLSLVKWWGAYFFVCIMNINSLKIFQPRTFVLMIMSFNCGVGRNVSWCIV